MNRIILLISGVLMLISCDRETNLYQEKALSIDVESFLPDKNISVNVPTGETAIVCIGGRYTI